MGEMGPLDSHMDGSRGDPYRKMPPGPPGLLAGPGGGGPGGGPPGPPGSIHRSTSMPHGGSRLDRGTSGWDVGPRGGGRSDDRPVAVPERSGWDVGPGGKVMVEDGAVPNIMRSADRDRQNKPPPPPAQYDMADGGATPGGATPLSVSIPPLGSMGADRGALSSGPAAELVAGRLDRSWIAPQPRAECLASVNLVGAPPLVRACEAEAVGCEAYASFRFLQLSRTRRWNPHPHHSDLL